MSDPKQLLCNVDYQFVALTLCIGSLFYWSYVLLDEALEISSFCSVSWGSYVSHLSVMSLSVILLRYWSCR